jgi:hypothetical protein
VLALVLVVGSGNAAAAIDRLDNIFVAVVPKNSHTYVKLPLKLYLPLKNSLEGYGIYVSCIILSSSKTTMK